MNMMEKPDWAMNKRERENAERVKQGLAPKRRKGPLIVLGVVLVAAIAGGGYKFATKPAVVPDEMAAEVEAPVVVQLAPFEVITLAPQRLFEALRITGSLEPGQQVHLSAEVSARLVSVNGRAGDTVAKGDVLAQFDVATLENQLAQQLSQTAATRAQADNARTQFERTEQLVERGLAAPNQLDSARSTLEQLTASLAAQETAVDNARTSIERATVIAPFDGVISQRSIDPGAFVGTGSPLFTVVDLNQLEVEAAAPVGAAPKLTRGQTVSFSVEGFDARSFTGVVDRISPVAISGSRMLPVFVSLNNDDGALRGGMFASGQIVLEEKADGLALPAAAVETNTDPATVMVIRDGVIKAQPVEVLRTWDGGALVEISGDIAPGDQVLAEPMPQLTDGTQVTVLER
ncbi:MAG: efflux RND transporter periplasmic adaptor subunit [Maritimibacter sp.]